MLHETVASFSPSSLALRPQLRPNTPPTPRPKRTKKVELVKPDLLVNMDAVALKGNLDPDKPRNEKVFIPHVEVSEIEKEGGIERNPLTQFIFRPHTDGNNEAGIIRASVPSLLQVGL